MRSLCPRTDVESLISIGSNEHDSTMRLFYECLPIPDDLMRRKMTLDEIIESFRLNESWCKSDPIESLKNMLNFDLDRNIFSQLSTLEPAEKKILKETICRFMTRISSLIVIAFKLITNEDNCMDIDDTEFSTLKYCGNSYLSFILYLAIGCFSKFLGKCSSESSLYSNMKDAIKCNNRTFVSYLTQISQLSTRPETELYFNWRSIEAMAGEILHELN
jgi:hypothetical protein